MRNTLAGLVAAVFLTGCAYPETKQLCSGTQLVETQLYLGMSMPQGTKITESEFAAFLKSDVVSRFPQGFTVFDAKGFWRDAQKQKTIAENSKVIFRLHQASMDEDTRINEIIQSFKRRFAQDSVLRTDKVVCAHF